MEPLPIKPKRETILPVYLICALLFNLGAVVDSIYGIAKKVTKFWWIAFIVVAIFFPGTLLELLQGVIKLIEDIKALF